MRSTCASEYTVWVLHKNNRTTRKNGSRKCRQKEKLKKRKIYDERHTKLNKERHAQRRQRQRTTRCHLCQSSAPLALHPMLTLVEGHRMRDEANSAELAELQAEALYKDTEKQFEFDARITARRWCAYTDTSYVSCLTRKVTRSNPPRDSHTHTHTQTQFFEVSKMYA